VVPILVHSARSYALRSGGSGRCCTRMSHSEYVALWSEPKLSLYSSHFNPRQYAFSFVTTGVVSIKPTAILAPHCEWCNLGCSHLSRRRRPLLIGRQIIQLCLLGLITVLDPELSIVWQSSRECGKVRAACCLYQLPVTSKPL
jgi:hypothetical protein